MSKLVAITLSTLLLSVGTLVPTALANHEHSGNSPSSTYFDPSWRDDQEYNGNQGNYSYPDGPYNDETYNESGHNPWDESNNQGYDPDPYHQNPDCTSATIIGGGVGSVVGRVLSRGRGAVPTTIAGGLLGGIIGRDACRSRNRGY